MHIRFNQPAGMVLIQTELKAIEIEKLIKDTSRIQHKTKIGHAAWRTWFTREKIASQYETLY